MDKKILSLILFAFLLIPGFLPIAIAHNAPFPGDFDPAHAVIDTIGEPETVDPAWCYDTGSGEIISNVYSPLVFYDLNWTDGPYKAGLLDVFRPDLATDVGIEAGPTGYAKTFTFKIRGTDTSTHTFTALNGVVDIFKDGQIYGTKLFVRDKDYGRVGMAVGPITVPTDTPAIDGLVDRANVAAKQFTGDVTKIADTTWEDTTAGEKIVVIGFNDTDTSGTLNTGDTVAIVRKCRLTGVIWNVVEYYALTSLTAGPPISFTATAVPVYFHNGAELEPSDVEYSFERFFIQDRAGGPLWMVIFPVLNEYETLGDPTFGDKINNAFVSDATTATIHLVNDFPETTFLQILGQSWSCIVNKDWAVALGDFDGNWAAGWATIFGTWHAPDVSFIEDTMMGTGPYVFDLWQHGVQWTIVRNRYYYDGWPARVEATSKNRMGGFWERISENLLPSWVTRRPRFTTGTADFTAVPRMYRDQVLGVEVASEPIRCFFPVVPNLAVDANFYNFDINPSSPYLGPGFDPANPYAWGEDRVPIDLFNDPLARSGFTAAFNFPLFLSSAYLGEADAPATPIIPGLSYVNPNAAAPEFDLAKAAADLQAAHGGDLWANGMSMTLLYNSGNVPRETAATMLANNINSLNENFHLTTQEVAWGSTYLPQMVAGMLPCFIIGWLQDYPDPDNFAYPFMHSGGAFSAYQSYSNPRVDELIMAGALMPMDSAAYNGELDYADPRPYFDNPGGIPPDTRWPRRSIYYELQRIYYDDRPGFTINQAKGRHWEQWWVRGWYYNGIYPGGYYYHWWEYITHFGDADCDGIVGVLDSATVSACWTKVKATSILGPLGYAPQADMTGGIGATTGGNTGLVVGLADGRVSVLDSSLVSSYWDEKPKGPSHP